MSSRRQYERDKNVFCVAMLGVDANFADVSTNIVGTICMAPLIDRHHVTESVGGSRQFRGMCEENNANQIGEDGSVQLLPHTTSVFSFQFSEP
jgi:hypothetical protein